MFLTLQNVVKVYESTRAVDGISLQIPEKAVYGLLGPNGAGKTTLIRMITGILLQDDGSIELQSIDKASDRYLHIGYMPEERGLYKKMKVGEQLLYLAQLKNMSRRQAQTQLDYWLEKFAIQDWRNKEIGELSTGMQQKVQFIATVIHQPKLIILDEPFSGLDPINSRLIEREIFDLRDAGATILFSTHRMEQVEEICESIALINRGKLILDGSVREIKNQFKQHQYIINYSGDIAELLPHSTPQSYQIIAHTAHELRIQLIAPHSAAQALRELLDAGIAINGFRELLPSINDIFITQVTQTSNAVPA
ncbi:MAG: ATP-binding cassette domain-containing protein [Chitinophagales bacterium]|nr:ATP-binding cassette domain-containing protein [Chitinophagales bacterium]